MQGAHTVSVSDSQGPALLAAGGRTCHAWCSRAVVERTATVASHGQELPSSAEVLLSSLPLGSATAKTSSDTFYRSTALGPAQMNAEARGASRDYFCTLL